MKSLLIVALFGGALAALAVADHHHGGPHHHHGGGGYHEPHYHHPAYYQYGYKVHDDYHKTNFGHNEKRDGKHTHGEYYVHLPDGRLQTVTYSVDGYKGYVAHVKYSGKPYHPPHHPKPHYKPHHHDPYHHH